MPFHHIEVTGIVEKWRLAFGHKWTMFKHNSYIKYSQYLFLSSYEALWKVLLTFITSWRCSKMLWRATFFRLFLCINKLYFEKFCLRIFQARLYQTLTLIFLHWCSDSSLLSLRGHNGNRKWRALFFFLTNYQEHLCLQSYSNSQHALRGSHVEHEKANCARSRLKHIIKS